MLIVKFLKYKIFYLFFFVATSTKNTDKSNDVRVLSRDLLKKRNLLLTLLVSLVKILNKFL
jgi:hypothetical protein